MNKEQVNSKGEVLFEATGTIKSFNSVTGYGFILSIESLEEDIFFHVSQMIIKDKEEIEPGLKVEFLYKRIEGKGLRAYQIKKA